jgi:CRP-like cAMP-binding protein
VRREIRVEAFLAQLPLFTGLRPAELARIAAGTRRHELARGGLLFRAGEPSTGIFAVVYGRIELRARARVAGVVDAGESFAEAVMFLGKPYIVSARAAADSLALEVSKQAVFAELERNPLFARRIIAALAQRVEAMVRELERAALGTAGERFVAWLLRDQPAGASGEAVVTLPAAKRAIAARLNLSAEHFSRVLKALSRRGLLEVRGRELRIPDVARLRAGVS